jgi:FtsH-binding integral membrane protein
MRRVSATPVIKVTVGAIGLNVAILLRLWMADPPISWWVAGLVILAVSVAFDVWLILKVRGLSRRIPSTE